MGIKGTRLVPRAEAIHGHVPLVHGEIAPFRDYVEKHLPTTTLATIHQRLRDEHGLTVSVSSLRRYVRAEFAEVAAEQATVLREDPPPGAEAQLGYEHLGSWLDPESGARRSAPGFIMTLSFSRHLFCFPVPRMTQERVPRRARGRKGRRRCPG